MFIKGKGIEVFEATFRQLIVLPQFNKSVNSRTTEQPVKHLPCLRTVSFIPTSIYHNAHKFKVFYKSLNCFMNLYLAICCVESNLIPQGN
jgi:hypothetical protein